jgi:hypothetical protein
MSSGHYCDVCYKAYYKCMCNVPEKVVESKQEKSNYLSSGGLFNPKLANHNEVRNLLIELRTLLDRIESRL